MHGELRVVDDVAAAFADLLRDLTPTSLALSGGTTARRCYDELGARGGDWSATTFLLGDERWVPVDHPDSNEGQARRAWLERVPIGNVLSLRGDGADRWEQAAAYERALAGLRAWEACHLGMGTDGHVASLFPGGPETEADDRLVVPADAPAHRWPRLTLTLPAISRFDVVVLTVTGAEKAAALRRARSGDPALPAARVRARQRLVWLVDPAAAA